MKRYTIGIKMETTEIDDGLPYWDALNDWVFLVEPEFFKAVRYCSPERNYEAHLACWKLHGSPTITDTLLDSLFKKKYENL